MEMKGMTPEDVAALRAAHRELESQSFAMKVAAKVGMPIEALMRMIPAKAKGSIGVAVNKALDGCLRVALAGTGSGMGTHRAGSVGSARSKRLHTLTTAVTGAAGGFFGLPGLLVELPVTTTVMLHSIIEIARGEGEDLSRPESALSCLEVLALGADGSKGDAMESAYYATRAAMAQVTRDAAAYITQKGLSKEGAPVLVAFLSRIAARFGLEVSEKAAAQLVPVAGAAGGLALNVMFMHHFQHVAEGHFTIRRLERQYGGDAVRREYDRIGAGA